MSWSGFATRDYDRRAESVKGNVTTGLRVHLFILLPSLLSLTRVSSHGLEFESPLMSVLGVIVTQLKGISILFSPAAVSEARYLQSRALPLASRTALAILRMLSGL